MTTVGPSKATQRNAVFDLFTENVNRLALVGVHVMNFEIIMLTTFEMLATKSPDPFND